MKILSIPITTIAALVACALNGQTMGSVAGAVFENGMTPLAGATISYRGSGHMEKDSQARMRYVRPEVFGSVKSRPDGTFAIIGLPPDRYTICAYGTLPVHISSCVWNTSDHRVSVASGQSVTGLNLNVTRGALLDITLTDLTGCAARYSKAPIYVFAGPSSVEAYPLTATAGAYHYRALVPQATPLRVRGNHRCSFGDAAGGALANSVLSVPAVQAESGSATLTAR